MTTTTDAQELLTWLQTSAKSLLRPLERNRWADALSALLAEREWRPVSEAPFNEDVLIFAPDSTDNVFIAHRCIFRGQSITDWDGSWYEQNVDACPSPVDVTITHWLPLPPPPNPNPAESAVTVKEPK